MFACQWWSLGYSALMMVVRLVFRSYRAREASRLHGAFSLVEVVLALGIISFAFIALLGMLPVGLKSLKSSQNDTITTLIVQKVLAEAQQTRFANLSTLAGERFFTDEGGDATASNYIYHALVSVPLDGSGLPSKANSGPGFAIVPPLRTILVEISKNRTVQAAKANPQNNDLIQKTFMIADVGL
jgi:uncharacterized protein (TIGR02598 family)